MAPERGRFNLDRVTEDSRYIYVAIDGNERGNKTSIYRLEPADESRTSDSGR